MRPHEIAQLTSHPDVNGILVELTRELGKILDGQLVGLYLTGSLTYGDFDRGSSDIDILTILSEPLSEASFERVRAMHARIGDRYPEWATRIEGSYVTGDMLGCVEPPSVPRPYINGGAFWDPEPRYGNEWLINLYALRERGVALAGPDPKQLVGPVDIEDVRRASARDLFDEWVPKLGDRSFFESSHHQAYVTLTLCRILHRAAEDDVVSKRVASAWVKETCDLPWIIDLVERAERWQHGEDLDSAAQVRAFIAFSRDQLKN